MQNVKVVKTTEGAAEPSCEGEMLLVLPEGGVIFNK